MHGSLHGAMARPFNPLTAKDAIWRPHGITHRRICLSARYNFYYAFQQPLRYRSKNIKRINFVIEESYYTTEVCLVLYVLMFCKRNGTEMWLFS